MPGIGQRDRRVAASRLADPERPPIGMSANIDVRLTANRRGVELGTTMRVRGLSDAPQQMCVLLESPMTAQPQEVRDDARGHLDPSR